MLKRVKISLNVRIIVLRIQIVTKVLVSALHSYNGRVGSLFPNHNIFVTMPNMDVVHAPIPFCHTRMRRMNNFAKDDPSYWPQPFHGVIGHLSVIPCPKDSLKHPLHFVWYQPGPNDFSEIREAALLGFGRLSLLVCSKLNKLCSQLLQDMAGLLEEVKMDPFLVRGRDQIQKYLERISMPGSRDIVFLQLACLQRVFLETYARHEWLRKWVPRLENVDNVYEVEPHVMGAFTDQLDTAATLYRIGIPVW